MLRADAAALGLALGDATAGAGQGDVHVQAENACLGVVWDAQVDMLIDTEAEVAGVGEVAGLELVLLDLEAALQDVQSLVARHGHVARDLLVTADTESTDGVSASSEDGLLLSELLQHAASVRKAISGLSDGAVQGQGLNLDLPHGVGLVCGHG